MDHATGAMGSLLPKLLELFKPTGDIEDIEFVEGDLGKYGLPTGVRMDIRTLRRTLEYKQIALGKSADPDDDDQVRLWSDVRELSYDMEDVVDTFLVYEQGSHPAPNKERLMELVKEMTDLLTAKSPATPASASSPTTTVHPHHQAIQTDATQRQRPVGIHRKRRKLIELMGVFDDYKVLLSSDDEMPPSESSLLTHPSSDGYLSDEEDLSNKIPKIVSVVGFGGVGKTTLARAAYEEIKGEFKLEAFVSVGRNARPKIVLMDILLALNKEKKYKAEELANLDEQQLTDELLIFLGNKRYLIVIDDIWEEKLWNDIKHAFRDKDRQSHVLTTTRDISIAKACCSFNVGLVYEMEPLSEKNSESLFYGRIFPREGGQCPPEFQQVSAGILRKCGGVPLAIITIASILGEGTQSVGEWNALLKAMGHGITGGDNAHVEEMRRILSLSYYNLPCESKNCLLYLSLFPENYEIKKDRLIWRWIAEGFIQLKNQKSSLFEVGESNFNMLINRSLIQPVDIDAEGKVNACRVHDMVLDLLCTLSSKANFVTMLDGFKKTTPNSDIKVRRLSVKNSTSEITRQLSAATSMAHVRSFTLLSPGTPPLSDFKVIRVLDLEDCNLGGSFLDTNPWCVKNLMHMKYLGLRNTSVGELPAELGKLKFLQILDLRRANIKELPSSLIELTQLICLHVNLHTVLPKGFGNLTNLEELSEVMLSPDSGYIVEELGYLTKLRVLEICRQELDESVDEILIQSLNKLLEIRSLAFNNVATCTFNAGRNLTLMQETWKPSSHLHKFKSIAATFSTLPTWIESSHISCLSLCLKKVTWDDIEILGKLEELRSLRLTEEFRASTVDIEKIQPGVAEGGSDDETDTHKEKKEEFKFEDDLFQVIRECRFRGFVILPSMFPKGAMPMVQTLGFHVRAESFVTGEDINLDMAHLPSLKLVDVMVWCGDEDDFTGDDNGTGVKEAKAALRAAAASHPNRPTIDIDTNYEDNTPSDCRECDFSQEQIILAMYYIDNGFSWEPRVEEESKSEDSMDDDEDEAHPRPAEIGEASSSRSRGTWKRRPHLPHP